MKGICFTEPLHYKVVQREKTMTRRIVPEKDFYKYYDYENWAYSAELRGMPVERMHEKEFFLGHSRYKVGEVVYLKEPYFIAAYDELVYKYGNDYKNIKWANKLFMPANYARSFIKIIDVKVERLQDISEEDCRREGIDWDMAHECNGWVPSYNDPDSGGYPDYRAAFAALIDATCGKDTWEDNPWVYAYTFELTT